MSVIKIFIFVVDEDEDQKKNLTFKNNIFGFFDS